MDINKFKNQNILIISENGFIGSHLFLKLRHLSKNIIRTVYSHNSEKNQLYKFYYIHVLFVQLMI